MRYLFLALILTSIFSVGCGPSTEEKKEPSTEVKKEYSAEIKKLCENEAYASGVKDIQKYYDDCLPKMEEAQKHFIDLERSLSPSQR